jgi:hypothetical protein
LEEIRHLVWNRGRIEYTGFSALTAEDEKNTVIGNTIGGFFAPAVDTYYSYLDTVSGKAPRKRTRNMRGTLMGRTWACHLKAPLKSPSSLGRADLGRAFCCFATEKEAIPCWSATRIDGR